MSLLALVLIGCAVLLVVAAEWPRLGIKLKGAGDQGRRRQRSRRKTSLRLVHGEQDDFAESVRRDLDRLPVIKEPNDRTR